MSKNKSIKSKTTVDISVLTDIELEVLRLIKKGFASSQIAKERGCSTRTIEKHRSNIIGKLKLPSTQNTLYIFLMQNPDL